MRIQKQLEKIGLNEKEAKVYLAGLNMKNGSVLDISRETGLPKSSAHDIVNKLVKEGLLHKYTKGKRARFTAADPSILKRKVDEKSLIVGSLLPELQAKFMDMEDSPRIQFYNESWGIDKVLNQILNEAKSLITITSPEQTFVMMDNFFPWFPERRAKLGIPLRAIFSDSAKARERKKEEKKFIRETKIIKTDKPFGALVFVWANKVAIITYKDHPTATLIEHKEIADSYRVMFETMWNQVPEVGT